MRTQFIIKSLRIIFLLGILFWSCTSCNENKPQNDHDQTDIDTVTEQDMDLTDIVPDPDITDNDETPYKDVDSDIDNSAECLDLKIQENVINTPFPFKDKDGKPTFCRSGCDTPTETDPQCVRNIWEWDNWGKYQEYLEENEKNPDQDVIRECYPWPCVLPDMKANATLESFNSKCDRWLTVNDFKAKSGTVWTHGMSDGVAGLDFSGRAIEYDPEKDEYLTVGQNKNNLSFNENRYIVLLQDSNPPDNPHFRTFVVSIFKKDKKYYYELIYDNDTHNAFFTRPSFSGEKWVLIQIKAGPDGSKTDVQYAKAGVWEWQKIEGIGSPLAQEGNIVGDYLTFITNDREMYYCDLTKSPKHINDCKLINRPSGIMGQFEEGHSPRIDTENEKRLVYSVYRQNIFVEVDFTDVDNPKYTEYEVSKNKETTYSWQIDTFRGNKILYSDFYTMEAGSVDVFGCFYRLDKKKSYCPQENIFSASSDNLMAYNTFWGEWHLWKMASSPVAVMRDWECYCEESGICPFEE